MSHLSVYGMKSNMLPFSITKCFHDSINKNTKFNKYLRVFGVHELVELNDFGSLIVILF